MKGIDTHRLGSTRSRSIAAKLHVKPLALLVSLLATGQALAVQTGTVTGGAATITQNGATTTIQQNSDRAIVNWNNFDIGQGERVNIQQPNANAAILNRVVGGTTATQIQGALDANGRVFVINPNGIVVGQQGSINANGVVLSTLNLSDNAFMTGDSFSVSGGSGSGEGIRNDGTITATRGAVLLGNQVVNGATGQITTSQGDVSLMVDSFATIDLMPDGSIAATSGSSELANALVANDGRMTAAGSVLMQATGSNAIVRNTGMIEATGLAGLTDTGTVALKAKNGIVNVDGTVIGQQVNLTAKNVAQAANASLHADGDLTITTTAPGKVDLNGDIRAGNTFSVRSNGSNYANVTLNGTVAAQNVDLSADTLSVTQNAILDAVNLAATSNNDMTIASHLSADSMSLSSRAGQIAITGDINASNLAISTKNFTQAANASLHADGDLTITTTAPGKVDLNGDIRAGNTFSVRSNGSSYANVTLNGTVAAQNVDLSADTLSVTQNATLDAVNLAATSNNDMTIAGHLSADSMSLSSRTGQIAITGDINASNLAISTKNFTQAANASLHADGDLTITTTAPGKVDLNGDIRAGNTFSVRSNGSSYANVTLNGTVAAQNVDLSADTLSVTQNATLDAASLAATSNNDMTVAGYLSADSMDLVSRYGNLTIQGDNHLSGNRINLSSTAGQTNITGDINAPNLSISTKDFTQAADVSLHADNDLTLTASGQVDLNGGISAGDTFTLSPYLGYRYANVMLNGAVDAQNVKISADQLDVLQNAAVNAGSVSLSSQGQTNIAGSVIGTSNLSINGLGGITQTAGGLLRFGDTMTAYSSNNSVLLNGTIDAGSEYSVLSHLQEFRFGAGLYQPGQGFGGASALPSLRAGQITLGTGSITQDGSAINVMQTSDKLIIDWKDFNIAAGESINFLQPNANAAVLNKVTSGIATTIDGALNANGRVFVVNPYGIVVGTTGTINANSVTLAAGYLLSPDEDVLSADTWSVTAASHVGVTQTGLMKNSGDIHTANGVTLIGAQVMNMTSGRIYTWDGNIAMVAGGEFQVSQNVDGSMRGVDVVGAIDKPLVANDGRITADSGYVKLDAYTSSLDKSEVARSTGQIDALNRTDTMSAPGELAAGNILVSGRHTWGEFGTVNIRGRLIGQNVTVRSDGNLNLFGGGVLTLRQQSADPDFNKITLEGNRITVAPEGFTVQGNALVRLTGSWPIFDQQGPLNVTGGTLSMQDIEPLAN
jgi:filamentous hemagglutinin family protein